MHYANITLLETSLHWLTVCSEWEAKTFSHYHLMRWLSELATYAWTGPWLWLFLNGLHAEYLSIISNEHFVKSLEDRFWTQRTINELAHSCWELPDEASLSLDRQFLTPISPSRLSRVFSLFRQSHRQDEVPNRCFASFKNFAAFFPVSFALLAAHASSQAGNIQ